MYATIKQSMLFYNTGNISLLIQIQIAVIGIIVIAGFFYVWRLIHRIEEKLEKMSLVQMNKTQTNNTNMNTNTNMNSNTNMNTNTITKCPGMNQNQCIYNKKIDNDTNIMNTNDIHKEYDISDVLNFDEADNMADELMKQVFGNRMSDSNPTMVMFSMSKDIPSNISSISSKEIRVEEVLDSESESDDNSESEEDSLQDTSDNNVEKDDKVLAEYTLHSNQMSNQSKEDKIDTETVETETEENDVNPLSKNKLKKMTIETLKKLCTDRGLQTEGTKIILIERLLGISR